MSCSSKEEEDVYIPTSASLKIPELFQQKLISPVIPSNNPLTEEGIALGKKLFFDTILSKDNTQSCATCHDPKRAFTDETRFSDGVDRRQLQIGYQLPLAKNHGLRLSYKRILNDDDAVTESSLAYRYYY